MSRHAQTPAPNVPDCAGYVRVSTERQAGEVYTSLADQRRACEELAARLGHEVGKWFSDEGASGATAEKRPAFMALLQWCEENPRSPKAPGYVLVLNGSRFGRFDDPEESAYWRVALKKKGWVVRFAEGDESEDFATRTLMRSIRDVEASQYRKNIKANSRRGMRGTAEQGMWSRREPFGYRRKVVYPPGRERVLEPAVPKAGDEKVALVPHEGEAATVRWMFEEYATGRLSLIQLAKALLKRAPVRRWSPGTLHTLLRNPVYLGDVVGGRRRFIDGSKTESIILAQSEWYGKKGAHIPLVSRELFDRVQQRIAENRDRGKGVAATYVLSGLVTCPHCGAPYIGGGGGTKPGRRFYKDSGGVRFPAPICPGKIGCVMKHVLDDAVIGEVGRVLARPSVQKALADALDRHIAALAGSEEPRKAETARGLAKLTARRDRLVAAIAEGTVTREEAAGQLETIRAEIALLSEQRTSERFTAQRASVLESERARLLSLASDFAAIAKRLDGPRLRDHLRTWLARAEFDKNTRDLTLTIRRIPAVGAFLPFDWPGRG